MLTRPLLVPAIRLDFGDPDAEVARALERAPRPWCAGFLLFGGEAEQVARLTSQLRDAAGRPIFIASDMERGAGQQVKGLRSLPEAGVWGLAATPAEVERFGAMTAEDALSVGVDVLFAPVVDVMSDAMNPIVGNRAYGWDPQRVATLGTAFMRGALRAGALPVAKHFPGHGATATDSHDEVPEVRARADVLLARDLLPFDQAIASGACPAVMTAHVRYPALDPSGVIATFSRTIVDRVRGLAPDPEDVAVFTDALCMQGACAGIGEVEAARRALRAGCDLLLYAGDEEAVGEGLAGEEEARLDAAEGRVRSFYARAALARGEAADGPGALADEAVVKGVAERAVAQAWVGPPETSWALVLDDDDIEARGRLLAEAGHGAGVPVHVVRLSRGDLPPEPCPVEDGWTVILMASVRSSKGRAGLSPAGHEVVRRLEASATAEEHRIRWIVCGPQLPLEGVHLPGAGPEIEAALARHLFGPRP